MKVGLKKVEMMEWCEESDSGHTLKIESTGFVKGLGIPHLSHLVFPSLLEAWQVRFWETDSILMDCTFILKDC